jgi:hypothetical protein
VRDRELGQQLVRAITVALVVILLVPHALAGISKQPDPPPDGVLTSADEYVISKVGKAFFDSCLSRRRGSSRYEPLAGPSYAGNPSIPDWMQHPRYVVIYNFGVPGREFVDEVVVVNIKEDGGWFREAPHDEGLPDCISQPRECEFPIDRAEAKAIAREAGLEEGRSFWRSDFRWSGRTHKTYVWEVRNELEELGGELVLIDANDGTVLEVSEWRVEVQGHPPTAP